MKGAETPRHAWLDAVRSLVIILVVNMHACVTFSHVGDWYVKLGPGPGKEGTLGFVLWQAHLQSFFMGLLFFVSGYFATGSLMRRGAGSFLGERLRRLGVPLLLQVLVLQPLMVFVLLGHSGVRYYYLSITRLLSGTGPLWFVEVLLLFCAVLVGVEWFSRSSRPLQEVEPRTPGGRAVLWTALGLSAGTFLVRTWMPIGSSFLNIQFCFMPQYVVAFFLGRQAWRGGWLESLARSRFAARAGVGALLLGPLFLVLILVTGGEQSSVYAGGTGWQALCIAVWEQCVGVCLGLGVLAFAVRRLSGARNFLVRLAPLSFVVYVIHAPILVAVSLQLDRLGIDAPLSAMLLLTFVGLGLSVLVAALVRRLLSLLSQDSGRQS